MSLMNRWYLAAALAALVAWPQGSFAGQAPAKAGTKATVDIEYSFEGNYSNKKEYDTVDWRLKRNLKVSYEIYAGDLSIASAFDKSQNKQLEADTAAVSAQSQAMAANNADLMANVQKVMEACGEDEACIEKAAMNMAQQPGAQKQLKNMQKDGKAVSDSAQAMSANSPPRFQVWTGKPDKSALVGGAASIEETLHSTVYDPGCFKTNNICTYDRARKGAQAVDAAAKAIVAASPMVEVDTVKDLVSVTLPVPMMDIAADEKSTEGTKKVAVPFYPGYVKDIEDGLKFVSVAGRQGEKSIKLKELGDYNGPVTFTVRWQFRGS
jgi:hypothetical protein